MLQEKKENRAMSEKLGAAFIRYKAPLKKKVRMIIACVLLDSKQAHKRFCIALCIMLTCSTKQTVSTLIHGYLLI